jgi:RNA ligase
MPKLSDLMPLPALEAAVEEGLVRVQSHSGFPLRIFNYTEQAVYSRTWTEVTTQCRGLIADSGTGEIVARPWPKFFNYGEHEADSLDLTAPVEVTDKADGSLGILYPVPGGHAIATRGSFTSEQAIHATALYQDTYEERWKPHPDWTYLFEIVYPANRIVLDYGDMDDLVLLGAVHLPSGEPAGPRGIVQVEGWPGPVIDVHAHLSLADALAAEPRPNAEGLVVRYLHGAHAGTMIKLKQADYVALHRIITGLTARRLWERAALFATIAAQPDVTAKQLGQRLHLDVADVQSILDAGPDWADEVRKTAPEEFTEWIDATLTSLADQALEIVDMCQGEAFGWQGTERKLVAAGIAGHPYRSLVFSALDGRDITAQAWAAIRPEAEKPFMARSEDVA